MIELATQFPYLGSRTYIHGTSILSALIDELEAHGRGRVTLKRVKFQRQAQSNGRLVLTPGPIDAGSDAGANCTFVAAVDDRMWRGFFAEDGRAVTQRIAVDYPIKELEAQRFGGCCRIAPATRDELIRCFIEANKRFHEACVEHSNSPAIRFGYIESWTPPVRSSTLHGELEAMNLIIRKSDDGLTTINRLTYTPDSGDAQRLTLCFHVAPMMERA